MAITLAQYFTIVKFFLGGNARSSYRIAGISNVLHFILRS
jgi:hypothetical protein